jgi:PAS domain S-box-containing protein
VNTKESIAENIARYENGKILDCSSNFARIFGYETTDIEGMSLFHFFPKIFRELTTIELMVGSHQKFETLAVRKDSSTFPVDIVINAIEKNGSTVTSLTVSDNVDRKELEYKLEKTTALQKAILDSSSFAIIATDFSGIIRTFNKGAEKMFRLKEEDAVDLMKITSLCLETEIRERAMLLSTQLNKTIKPDFSVLVENLQVQSSYESEWTCVRADNSQFVAQVTVTPLKDHLDEVSGYLFIANDVSDKKKAEAEIVDKSQLLNGILSNMPVFVFKVGNKGLFTQSIGMGLHHLNFKDNQLVGHSIYDTFPRFKSDIEKAYGGQFTSFVHATIVQDKSLHYEYFVFPDLSNKGGLIGFAQDITEKINAEGKLRESALTLTKTNNELTQFAHIVSHDLKAPLRAISSLSEWIEEGLREMANPEVMRNLSMLRSRVRKMQNLIDGILNYSRVGQMKNTLEEVDTNKLVSEVIQTIDAPPSFDIKIANNLPAILFNGILLEQLFLNLISNAIKYHNKRDGKISVAYAEEENYHLFSVTDNGPGVPPEGKEKIFQIFQTLQSKEREESTGVGLAIVKKIAEDHGGAVWVESDGRTGAMFTFKLPKNPVKIEG